MTALRLGVLVWLSAQRLDGEAGALGGTSPGVCSSGRGVLTGCSHYMRAPPAASAMRDLDSRVRSADGTGRVAKSFLARNFNAWSHGPKSDLLGTVACLANRVYDERIAGYGVEFPIRSVESILWIRLRETRQEVVERPLLKLGSGIRFLTGASQSNRHRMRGPKQSDF